MQNTSILAAEFTKGLKGQPDILDITVITDGRRTYLKPHEVHGRREARKLAIALGATPWNF